MAYAELNQTIAEQAAQLDGARAVLPNPWTKQSLLNLAEETGRLMGLNHTDIIVLRRIAKRTPAAAFIDPTVEAPICYERQIDMAASLRMSPAQLRRIERKLHERGLIRRDTYVNGYRGGSAGAANTSDKAGLALTPLIARLPEMIALRDQERRNEEEAARLRTKIRILRRQITLLAQQDGAEDYAALIGEDRLNWPRPRAYKTPQEMQNHIDRLEALKNKAPQHLHDPQENTARPSKMSGAACKNERRHIQNTNNYRIESCTAENPEQGAETKHQAEDQDRPPAQDCLEDKQGRKSKTGAGENNNTLVDKLTTAQIVSLCSEEMRFYIDNRNNPEIPCSSSDLEFAGLFRIQEMGIAASLYEEAVQALGWKQALIALIIIDRNRTHPAAPIRSPGAMLRTYLRLNAKNALNLNGSIFGLWKRHG